MKNLKLGDTLIVIDGNDWLNNGDKYYITEESKHVYYLASSLKYTYKEQCIYVSKTDMNDMFKLDLKSSRLKKLNKLNEQKNKP